MSGHKQPVSGVQWLSESEVISSSWDHSLRIWDIEAGMNTSTFVSITHSAISYTSQNGNSAIYGLSTWKDSSLVATAHADFTVRLWDQRQSGRSGSLFY